MGRKTQSTSTRQVSLPGQVSLPDLKAEQAKLAAKIDALELAAKIDALEEELARNEANDGRPAGQPGQARETAAAAGQARVRRRRARQG